MRVIPLHRGDITDYACVAYWVLGENNAPADRNTLVDTGSTDPRNLAFYLEEMARQAKGIGKKAVEQVVLTHAHFDHSGGLPGLKAQFTPDVFARQDPGTIRTWDLMPVRMGDQDGVIIHTPGHSEDSICVHVPGAGVLFSGDTLYRITDHLGTYPRDYLESLERLSRLDVRVIYPGHGRPVREGAQAYIRACRDNVSRSLLHD